MLSSSREKSIIVIIIINEIGGYKGQGDEEEDVSSYWMTLRKREDAGR